MSGSCSFKANADQQGVHLVSFCNVMAKQKQFLGHVQQVLFSLFCHRNPELRTTCEESIILSIKRRTIGGIRSFFRVK